MGGEGRSDAEEKLWQEAHGIAMLPTYDVVALDDMADLIVALVDRVAAEQTAALREENARLREALLRETEAFHNTGGECGWCGDSWLTHTASCLIGKWRALLADPEGQRAGEEWRALNELERIVRVSLYLVNGDRDIVRALAAVERARQP